MTLSILLVFHHDPSRNHWLLFDFALGNNISTTCYEPLEDHLRLSDIQKMHLLASFFSIHRPNQPVRFILLLFQHLFYNSSSLRNADFVSMLFMNSAYSGTGTHVASGWLPSHFYALMECD